MPETVDFIILLEELVWEAWLCNMEYGTGCLMWIVWKEQNHRLFEDNVISLDQLKYEFQHTFLIGHGVRAFLIVHLFLSS